MKKLTKVEISLVAFVAFVLASRGVLAIYTERAWIAPKNSASHLYVGSHAISFGIAQILISFFLVAVLAFCSQLSVVWKALSALAVALMLVAFALSLA